MRNTIFNCLINLHLNHEMHHGNNYEENGIRVSFSERGIQMTTICSTDDWYWNNDLSIVRWEDINPNRVYNFLRMYSWENPGEFLFVWEE